MRGILKFSPPRIEKRERRKLSSVLIFSPVLFFALDYAAPSSFSFFFQVVVFYAFITSGEKKSFSSLSCIHFVFGCHCVSFCLEKGAKIFLPCLGALETFFLSQCQEHNDNNGMMRVTLWKEVMRRPRDPTEFPYFLSYLSRVTLEKTL